MTPARRVDSVRFSVSIPRYQVDRLAKIERLTGLSRQGIIRTILDLLEDPSFRNGLLDRYGIVDEED